MPFELPDELSVERANALVTELCATILALRGRDQMTAFANTLYAIRTLDADIQRGVMKPPEA